MLTIEHLTKQFGEKTLFRDLCLTVDGPAVLWAPSGWGKTTLLRILMGLDTPTAGRVRGVGRAAAVFQEDRLCPQLTALQNVTLVLPGSEKQYKEQIRADFQQRGMDAAALTLPAARLSGGQERRAALLRALWAPSGCCASPRRPCCWTNPLPAWTRTPLPPLLRCCAPAAGRSRCCLPPTTGRPSGCWAGR